MYKHCSKYIWRKWDLEQVGFGGRACWGNGVVAQGHLSSPALGQDVLAQKRICAKKLWRKDVLVQGRFSAPALAQDVLAHGRFGAMTFWREDVLAQGRFNAPALAPDVLAQVRFGAALLERERFDAGNLAQIDNLFYLFIMWKKILC